MQRLKCRVYKFSEFHPCCCLDYVAVCVLSKFCCVVVLCHYWFGDHLMHVRSFGNAIVVVNAFIVP